MSKACLGATDALDISATDAPDMSATDVLGMAATPVLDISAFQHFGILCPGLPQPAGTADCYLHQIE
ncbi:hypothetical protein LuPra_04397 [Luteitalea pratensis]|uniref:Uncharacterized protein n=1 Tax=Luteitalea pratensis TaxID=1855912 RepID=A0A143PST0_LUTPR|nr:hypothetical protein LuPra_04397 [Luteitalea pratensis]